MEVLRKSSMVSYDLFYPVKCWKWVSWDLHKEYGSYFCEQPQSISFLFFHFTDFPAVLPSCSVSTGHTPQPSPLFCSYLCCCSSLSIIAVPGLSLCPDLFVSLFCSGAAAEYTGVQKKGCLQCVSLALTVRKAVICKEWLMFVLLSSAASSPGSTSGRWEGARFLFCTNPGFHQCPTLEATWLSWVSGSSR